MIMRNSILTRSLSILTGIMFLNLSFILTEVKSLELEKNNRTLFESLIRLVSGVGIEEEKDVSGETTNEVKSDINFHILHDQRLVKDILSKRNRLGNYTFSRLLTSHKEIFSPPPEV